MNVNKPKSDEGRTFSLKPLSKQGVESALSKAEHYRLLNQPNLAESICLDILAVEQDNQKAQIILLLALTDQFGTASSKARHAHELASKLKDEYSRIYYMGIVNERQGAASLESRTPGSDFDACEYYLDAMDCYEKAEKISPSGNNDAVLRWNTCARIIMQNNLKERPTEDTVPAFE